MRGQQLDVHERESAARQRPDRGRDRVVLEVLVVDRVVLVLLDQGQQVLHLDGDPAVVGDQGAEPLGEPDHVGDVRVHVVGHHQVRRAVFGADGRSGVRAQELRERGHTGVPRRDADVHRRLDAEAADPAVHHVLEQVPVVARHLDHESVGAETHPLCGVGDERARVLHPGGRVGGEVRVLAERLLRRDQRRDLREPAVGADPQVQRVRRFRLVQLVRGEKALTGWRRPKVDDARHGFRAAESASCHLLPPSPCSRGCPRRESVLTAPRSRCGTHPPGAPARRPG